MNGQSAAKPLSFDKYEERSETISKESREKIPEMVGLFNAKFYTLKDPRTEEIRYVGRTLQSLNTRLVKHVSEAKRNHIKKNGACNRRENWIHNLYINGYRPTIHLIKEINNIPPLEIYKIERELILDYISKGFNLVNEDDSAICLDLGTKGRKFVYQYDLQTKQLIAIYKSSGHASRVTGIHDSSISLICKDCGGYGRKSAGGYAWSYEKFKIYPFDCNRDDSSKPILVYKDGIFIKEYKNARIAASDMNIKYKGISKSCNNNVTYYGYKFKIK